VAQYRSTGMVCGGSIKVTYRVREAIITETIQKAIEKLSQLSLIFLSTVEHDSEIIFKSGLSKHVQKE